MSQALVLNVDMSTDRNWGDTGLARKGRTWVSSTLRHMSWAKKKAVNATLFRSGQIRFTWPGPGNTKMVLTATSGSEEFSVKITTWDADTAVVS